MTYRGPVEELAGDALMPQCLTRLRSLDPAKLPLLERTPRIGACVSGVGRILGVGLTYKDHAAAAGISFPAEPVLFV